MTTRESLSISLRESVHLGISKRTDFPLVLPKCALLIIDVQRYCCERASSDYYEKESLPQMIANIERLVNLFRQERDQSVMSDERSATNFSNDETRHPTNPTNLLLRGCEVIFVAIQSLTRDGRDMSLDYKLSGLLS